MVAEALADLLGIFALGESEDVHNSLFPRYLRTSRSSSSATPTAQGEALIRIRFSGSGANTAQSTFSVGLPHHNPLEAMGGSATLWRDLMAPSMC